MDTMEIHVWPVRADRITSETNRTDDLLEVSRGWWDGPARGDGMGNDSIQSHDRDLEPSLEY